MCAGVGVFVGDGFPMPVPLEHEAEQQEADAGSRWRLFVARVHPRKRQREERESELEQRERSDETRLLALRLGGWELMLSHCSSPPFFVSLTLSLEKKEKDSFCTSLFFLYATLLASLRERERRSLSRTAGSSVLKAARKSCEEDKRGTFEKGGKTPSLSRPCNRSSSLSPLSPCPVPLGPLLPVPPLLSRSTMKRSSLQSRAIAKERPGTSPFLPGRGMDGVPPLLLASLALLKKKKKPSHPLSHSLCFAPSLSQAPSLPLESACVKMDNGGIAAERASSAGKRRASKKQSRCVRLFFFSCRRRRRSSSFHPNALCRLSPLLDAILRGSLPSYLSFLLKYLSRSDPACGSGREGGAGFLGRSLFFFWLTLLNVEKKKN